MKSIILTAATAVLLLNSAPSLNAATIVGSYVDGTVADGAAFTNVVTPPAGFTVSALSQTGLTTSTSDTAQGYATPGGDEWLDYTAGTIGGTPVDSTDYLAFTVSGSGIQIAPSRLSFEISAASAGSTNYTISYTLFAAADGGSFADVGSGSFNRNAGAGISTPSTESLDLSALAAADSYEFRLALGDNSSQNNKSTIIQGIEFAVVPEPSATLLGGLGALLLLRRRRG